MIKDRMTSTDWLDTIVDNLVLMLRYYIDERGMSLNEAIAATKPHTPDAQYSPISLTKF